MRLKMDKHSESNLSMQCIICKEDQPFTNFTKEHIFPDSIGGNITLNCVCKSCNDFLGHSIDSKLTDHDLVRLIRLALIIPGKSGKVPNPFWESYIAGTQEKVRYVFDNSGNPKEIQQVSPKINIELEDDKRLKISVEAYTKPQDKNDKNKIIKIIDEKLRRKSLPSLSEKEEKQLFNAQPIISGRPLLENRLKIDIISYKRAIIKIAYELAYYWLGLDYLNDEFGELLRLIIFQDTQKDIWLTNSIDCYIDFHGEKVWFPHLKSRFQETSIHVGVLFKVGNKLRCYVKIFNIFQGVITISRNASLYPNFFNKLIAINSQIKMSEELEMKEKF